MGKTKGAEERFARLYARDYPRIVAAMRMIAGDPHRARDAVDEAVARAWERLRTGKEINDLGAWVRVVALNLLRTQHRRRERDESLRHRLGASVSVHGPDPAAHVDVQRALTTLTDRQREIVVLFYFLDLSVADVAIELGVDPGTVKTTLHRARAAIAGILGDGTEVTSSKPEEVTTR